MLETARLRLREWRREDREAFARLNADAEVMQHFPNCLNREESDAVAESIQRHFDRYGYGLYAAELRATGEFAGFVGLSHPSFEAHFTPCVEIGWRLAARFWNQGLATEGARAVLALAFGALGLREVVSFTSAGNIASRRVMEKLGMTHERFEDFDHPNLAEGHPLRRHVLYRLRRDRFILL